MIDEASALAPEHYQLQLFAIAAALATTDDN
jgi:hypothetical protein